MTFESLISPLDMGDFMRSYFRKDFCFVKGSSSKFTQLFTWERLNEILEFQQFGITRLNVVKKGVRVKDIEIYDYETPRFANLPFKPILKYDSVIDELKNGSVLIVNGINQMLPQVKELCENVQWVLQISAHINMYMSGGNAEGFELHWDNHDVFILQIEGEKYWEVYNPTINYPLGDIFENESKPTQQPIWEGKLRKGDMLYMPRGFWHKAKTENSESIHLTLGIHSKTGIDYADWLNTQFIFNDVFRKDIPLINDNDGIEKYSTELKEAIIKSLEALDLKSYLSYSNMPLSNGNSNSLPISIGVFDDNFFNNKIIKLNSTKPLNISNKSRKYIFIHDKKEFSVSEDIYLVLKELNIIYKISFEDLCITLADKYSTVQVSKILFKLAELNLIKT